VLGAVGKTGVMCSVGSYWRYYEATERLRKLLAPKNAPKPLLLSGQWLAPPPATAWRRDAKAGGLWLEEAYAQLDLARLLGGEVKRVSAFAASLAIKDEFPEATVKDACTAILQMQSGALTSLGAGSFLEEGFEAGFSVATQEACFWLRDGQLETRRGAETSIFSGADDAFALQSEAFLRAVQTGKRTEIRTNYADAMKTLRLGLALNRAGLGSKVVDIRSE
jgi:predicted dehydrogenase